MNSVDVNSVNLTNQHTNCSLFRRRYRTEPATVSASASVGCLNAMQDMEPCHRGRSIWQTSMYLLLLLHAATLRNVQKATSIVLCRRNIFLNLRFRKAHCDKQQQHHQQYNFSRRRITDRGPQMRRPRQADPDVSLNLLVPDKVLSGMPQLL